MNVRDEDLRSQAKMRIEGVVGGQVQGLGRGACFCSGKEGRGEASRRCRRDGSDVHKRWAEKLEDCAEGAISVAKPDTASV